MTATVVRCRWRTDNICPHPSLCRYGYECTARPTMEYREPPTELDPLGVAGDDDEPVILPCADDWLESYASRDYLPESED